MGNLLTSQIHRKWLGRQALPEYKGGEELHRMSNELQEAQEIEKYQSLAVRQSHLVDFSI